METTNRTRPTPATRADIPTGMVEVTVDQFYDLLKLDNRDIISSLEKPTYSTWKVRHTGEVWGWDAPGWENPRDEKIHAVRADLVKLLR